MKKEKSSAVEPNGYKPARTTIFLTEALSFNLDLHALEARRPKGEIVRDAIAAYLKKRGCESPHEIPKRAEIRPVGV